MTRFRLFRVVGLALSLSLVAAACGDDDETSTDTSAEETSTEAELADALTDDTWRQWRMPWTATPGAHRLAVRCTDGDGQLQREERDEPLPDGASGWQSLLVTVREPS